MRMGGGDLLHNWRVPIWVEKADEWNVVRDVEEWDEVGMYIAERDHWRDYTFLGCRRTRFGF